MHETNVYDYFAFGYNYYILCAYTEGKNVRGGDNSDSLENSLHHFFRQLYTLNLQVTLQAASDLSELEEQIRSMPEDAVVDAALAERVTQACEKLDVTLDSELKLRTAFVVTPGRFNPQHLLEEPWELLGNTTIEYLPSIAWFDFSNACRAIAFGLATAAAFHLMRCVEAMLREYYSNIVKRGRVRQLMWGPMVKYLRGRQTLAAEQAACGLFTGLGEEHPYTRPEGGR